MWTHRNNSRSNPVPQESFSFALSSRFLVYVLLGWTLPHLFFQKFLFPLLKILPSIALETTKKYREKINHNLSKTIQLHFIDLILAFSLCIDILFWVTKNYAVNTILYTLFSQSILQGQANYSPQAKPGLLLVSVHKLKLVFKF